MPQLFILAAVAATVVGWKLVRREMTRVEERVAAARRSTQAESRVHAGITLVRDPVTGVFRPQQ